MKIIPVFPIGTKVKLTKTVAFSDSSIKVGSVLEGTLSKKTGVNEPIRLNNGTNTGPVMTMKITEGKDYIVTTETSVYFMQVMQ